MVMQLMSGGLKANKNNGSYIWSRCSSSLPVVKWPWANDWNNNQLPI